MTEPAEVLQFWLGALADGFADDAHRRRWFAADPARDAEIRDRFGHVLLAAASGNLDSWLDSPEGALALVIVCDQFSRQIHRGDARAFATDPAALDITRKLVEQGEDQNLGFDQRAFLYMPFQHSESRLDQHTSIGLFSALRRSAPAEMRHHGDSFLDNARQHRDIVMRFGRFPHRNAVLGRTSGAAELTFLKSASSFGQSPAARSR